jgi:hypothetical protein
MSSLNNAMMKEKGGRRGLRGKAVICNVHTPGHFACKIANGSAERGVIRNNVHSASRLPLSSASVQ